MADAVMSGRRQAAPFSLSAVPITHVQREDAPKEKTDEEKYKEAAGKIGEAFLETPLGKELLEKVKQDKLVKGATEAGKSFIGTLPGKIIAGAAAAGAVAALAADAQGAARADPGDPAGCADARPECRDHLQGPGGQADRSDDHVQILRAGIEGRRRKETSPDPDRRK